MNRRELLRQAALGLTGFGAAGAELSAGSQVRQSAAPQGADPLYNPRVVQERAAATERDNDPVVKDIERQLKCTCGCNLDIYTCRTTDFTCTYSPALHRDVLDLLDRGKTPDEVIREFVARHGESALMAPPPRGFNLAGYLVPGILVALVALALAWVLVRRSGRPAPEAAPIHPGTAPTEMPSPGADPLQDERLRRALEEVED